MNHNQELDGCMHGRSSATSIPTTAGGTLMVPQSTSANQRSVVLTNRDAANPVFFNYAFGATGATVANASLRAGESVRLRVRNNIYGISTGGTVNVEWYTEEDLGS